jgi:hypothetical protein
MQKTNRTSLNQSSFIDSHLNRNLILSLLFVNIAFLVYFSMLAYFSRPHYDDLQYLWKLKEMNIWELIDSIYFGLSGRFAAYFIYGLVFKFILFTDEFRFFPILFGAIGFLVTWVAVRPFLKTISQSLAFHSVLLAFNLSVLTNIDFPVFFWLCAMHYYWLGPLLLLLILLIYKNNLSVLGWFFLITASIFIGGGQEAFSPVVLTILFCLGLYSFVGYSFSFRKMIADRRNQKILIALAIIFSAFVVVVAAPGNYNRLTMDEFVSPHSVTGFIKGFSNAIILFFYHQFFYIPYYVLLMLVFCVAGFQSRSGDLQINKSYMKLFWFSAFVFLLYLFASVLPSVFLWSGFGIQRNYTHVVFMLIVFLSLQSFLFGYFKLKAQYISRLYFVLIFALIMMGGITLVNIIYDSKSAASYASSVDTRIDNLKALQKKGVTGVVKVDSLDIPYTIDPKFLLLKLVGKRTNPRPVLYYISDVATERNDYSYHLKKLYGFDFVVRLK